MLVWLQTELDSTQSCYHYLSQLFLSTYFVKCRRTLLEWNSEGPYPSSEREIQFRRCLFTYSIKREIRHFHVVVVQKRPKKCTKSVMHVQSCCLFCKTYCFLTLSLPSASLDLKVAMVLNVYKVDFLNTFWKGIQERDLCLLGNPLLTRYTEISLISTSTSPRSFSNSGA